MNGDHAKKTGISEIYEVSAKITQPSNVIVCQAVVDNNYWNDLVLAGNKNGLGISNDVYDIFLVKHLC